MKKLFLFFSLLSFFSTGQVWSQTRKDIVGNPDFIWGEASGNSAAVADKAALSEITEQIAVKVASDFSMDIQKGDSEKREISAVVKTWSSATLTNCRKLVLDNGPRKFRILRYIHISEIEKAFREREKKITEMIKVAEKAESELRFDTALKYYYWALQLCSTLQSPSSHKCRYGNVGTEVSTVVLASERIDAIFRDLKFSFGGYVSEDKSLAVMDIKWKDIPVASLDYSYWDGISWSAITSAKDGKGPLELRLNSTSDKVDIKVEYSYENEASIDSELKTVMEVMSQISFPDSYFTGIKISGRNKPGRKQPTKAEKRNAEVSVNEGVPCIEDLGTGDTIFKVQDVNPYKKTVKSIADAIGTGNYESVRGLFTDAGWDVFSRLVKYGRAKVLEFPEPSCIEYDGEIQYRSLPMQFDFPNNSRKFTESLVFYFDKQSGKVSYLSFALSSVSVRDILKKDWQNLYKLTLINFMENYRTAFALKRDDYISTIFSDKAVIITGRVLKTVDNETGLTSEKVVLTRHNKDQYLAKLRQGFRSKEYINVNFSNAETILLGKGEGVFAIRIKQDYWSSNYSDTGFLMLVIDGKNIREPMITFRSWNPKTPEDDWYYLSEM